MSLLNGALISSGHKMEKIMFLKSLGPDLGTCRPPGYCSPQGSVRVQVTSLANIKDVCTPKGKQMSFKGSRHNPWPSLLEKPKMKAANKSQILLLIPSLGADSCLKTLLFIVSSDAVSATAWNKSV